MKPNKNKFLAAKSISTIKPVERVHKLKDAEKVAGEVKQDAREKNLRHANKAVGKGLASLSPEPSKPNKIPGVGHFKDKEGKDTRTPSAQFQTRVIPGLHGEKDKNSAPALLCPGCNNKRSAHSVHTDVARKGSALLQNVPMGAGKKTPTIFPKDGSDKLSQTIKTVVHPGASHGIHQRSRGDSHSTQPSKDGPKTPTMSGTGMALSKNIRRGNAPKRHNLDGNEKGDAKSQKESILDLCPKHLYEAIQKWLRTKAVDQEHTKETRDFRQLGTNVKLPKSINGSAPLVIKTVKSREQQGREDFKKLFGEEYNMNEQELDEIVNSLISEAMGYHDAGPLNTTAGTGTGAGDDGGRVKQMLAGEFVGSAATPFQQAINPELAGEVALQVDQANGKLGEAVDEVMAGLLEDSPSSFYTDKYSVGYLINTLSESGFEDYASIVTEVCAGIDETSVSKLNTIIQELSKDNSNKFFVEQLTQLAMQVIEMSDADEDPETEEEAE